MPTTLSETRKKLDPAAFCALPLVRRAYMAVVVGLAVFIATLVVLREPFRGYLAEVRLSGPAIQGLDLANATRWLQKADDRVVVIATAASDRSPRNQIRMTYQLPTPAPALDRLDELAGRWLYQYLPQRLNEFRHGELGSLRMAVNAARNREDAASGELESLRQRQLAFLLAATGHGRQPIPAITPEAIAPPLNVAPPTVQTDHAWRERLEALRVELARLLGNFTEEHPQVIGLRSQIERLEQQAGGDWRTQPPAGEGPELIPPPTADRQTTGRPHVRPAAADRFVTMRDEAATGEEMEAHELAVAVTAAVARHNEASQARQAAEHHLSDRMQELSSQPTAVEWSVEPAHIVTRLGGTPRFATLILGGLLAVIAGIFVLIVSAAAVAPPGIESAGELARALELPVIGNVAALRRSAGRSPRRLFSASRVRILVHAAELVVAAAVLACLLSICVEPTLAGQVLADPFGALSEVLGRTGI